MSLIGQKFSVLSLNADTVAGRTEACDDSSWTGSAAENYRSWVKREGGRYSLSRQLRLLSKCFWNASVALDTCGMDLSIQQPQLIRLAHQIEAARSAVASTGQAVTRTNAALSAAGPGPSSGPAGVTGGSTKWVKADSAVSSALGSNRQAQEELAALERQCFRVLDAFESSGHHCVGHLKTVITWEPLGAVVLPGMGAPKWLTALRTSVRDAFTQLRPDAKAWAEDPTSLAKLSKFVEDFGTVAATVGTADVGRTVEGDDDLSDLEEDALAAVLDTDGHALFSHLDGAVTAAEPLHDAVDDFQTALRANSGDADAALASLPADQRALIRSHVDVDDPAAVRTFSNMVDGGYAIAAARATAATQLNRAVWYGGTDVIGVRKSSQAGYPDR